jgi:uncharacterized membrane protein SpoIIM required for sporulation/ABC-type transport system involved in multi-copper enzyme maturation permease subunit
MSSLIDQIKPALIITRREVRDQFRDWRIVAPIILLTLFFPGLMNFTAGEAVKFVQQYGANLIATRFIPFLLMIVGFFPITISLVIALESFAGESERRSIEPLLSSPLTDWQLYLGKLLASLIPPLVGSYLGIATYLIGVYNTIQWTAEPIFLLQIILLTTVQALVMVSGAVVVSTQTTSVRAANLLSSFIVIPMALLIQGEAIVMFWAEFDTLWWIILGQAVIAGALIRTGIAHFNREDLLGREIDSIDLLLAWRTFWSAFRGDARTPKEWLFHEMGLTLRRLLIPIVLMTILLPVGIAIGQYLAIKLSLPANFMNLETLTRLDAGIVSGLRASGFMSLSSAAYIVFHNLRVMLLATALGIFTFGVLGILILLLPMALLGFIAQAASATGMDPLQFLSAFTLPHGLLEFPAIILTGAAIVRVGATLMTHTPGYSITDAFVRGLADWARIMLVLAIPLFIAASLLETFVTPYFLIQVLGQ